MEPDWAELPDLRDLIEPWARDTLEALRREAEALATAFAAQSLAERARRPRSQRGELGTRIRIEPSVRSGAGSFSCEWFQVRGRRRTRYLPKGRGDQYPPSAFRAAQPWERVLADVYEPRLARIRTLARSVSDIRRQASRHAALVRRLAVQETDADPADTRP